VQIPEFVTRSEERTTSRHHYAVPCDECSHDGIGVGPLRRRELTRMKKARAADVGGAAVRFIRSAIVGSDRR
jgi:ribosome biogenesis protein Nip4